MRMLFVLLVFYVSVVGQSISRVQFSADFCYLIVSWTITDSCFYSVQISKDRSFDNIEIEDSIRGDSICLPFDYVANTIYYCRVVQKSLSLRSLSSETVSFYTSAFVTAIDTKRFLRSNICTSKSSANFTLRGQKIRNSKISNFFVSKLSKKIIFSSF